MYKLKPLQWQTRNDGVIYADTDGLRYSYYIAPSESVGSVELALIENNGHYDEKMCTIHSSISDAQQEAVLHYEKIINSFLA